MKKTAAILLTAILFSGFIHSEVKAQENGVNGFILGAGGGALIGQAIGRNTESTLIGTAVGSMLGYVIGNERDKNGVVQSRTVYRPVERVYTPPPRGYYTETYVPPARYEEDICRESEVLATINGRPERIYATVCLEDGRWVMAPEDVQVNQTIIIDDDRRGRGKHKASHWKNRRPAWERDRYSRVYMDRGYHRSSW